MLMMTQIQGYFNCIYLFSVDEWVNAIEDSTCGLGGFATCCNSLSPTAREAGKPTINIG
jgi:hypothetical protein